MEARASFNRPSVSKTFVAVILVLVAMGLGAMGGYVAKGLTSGDTATSQGQDVHAVPGSILRQDNPVSAPAELPAYIQKEFPDRPSRLSQDDPAFIAQYAQSGGASADQAERGGHGQLP